MGHVTQPDPSQAGNHAEIYEAISQIFKAPGASV
jgi:hypothetical protein